MDKRLKAANYSVVFTHIIELMEARAEIESA